MGEHGVYRVALWAAFRRIGAATARFIAHNVER